MAKKDVLGHCPKCGGADMGLDEYSSDITTRTDDTGFPTIELFFECNDCGHKVSCEYDACGRSAQRDSLSGYNPDPEGELDEEEYEDE